VTSAATSVGRYESKIASLSRPPNQLAPADKSLSVIGAATTILKFFKCTPCQLDKIEPPKPP
jgi:hypothetical protein